MSFLILRRLMILMPIQASELSISSAPVEVNRLTTFRSLHHPGRCGLVSWEALLWIVRVGFPGPILPIETTREAVEGYVGSSSCRAVPCREPGQVHRKS